MEKKHDIQIWAHRGASGYAPENTMEAFRMAGRMGADGIELDIQLTRDGQIVVIHDEKINRTSNGKGYVHDYTLGELRQFNFQRTKPALAHADIPTLHEVLVYVRDYTDMCVNIELKTGIVFYEGMDEQTVKLVHELGMQDRVIYSSFNHYTIRHIQQMDPEAKVGLLYSDGFISVPAYAHDLGVDALHPLFTNLRYPNYVEECREYGLDLNVWTVNKEEAMLSMCELGVHAIITNYPDKAIRVRRQFEKTVV